MQTTRDTLQTTTKDTTYEAKKARHVRRSKTFKGRHVVLEFDGMDCIGE